MLGQRRRRWANIEPALLKCFVFSETYPYYLIPVDKISKIYKVTHINKYYPAMY